jgi:peroxin-5
VADFESFQQAQGPSFADFDNFRKELTAKDNAFAKFDKVWNKRAYDEAYTMASDNPFSNLSALEAMAEGIRLFNEGDLAGAKMAFERSVSQDDTNSEGWRWLGQCNADSDDDVKAIMCNIKAVETDPANLKAQINLGVSFTNELENERALHHLRSYIENNPAYAPLASTATGETEHERVVDMFMQAAAQAPEDPQPRTVLGVLYNLSREYDKAVECFKAALEVDPTDYSLWNKLGATQANSAQSEDSLHAYHQALETRPNYVRAWINVGMSFVNQGNYNDACQYYLRGLNLNPEAVHVWNYLRTALSLMDRMDLVTACDAHDLEAFKGEFDFA